MTGRIRLTAGAALLVAGIAGAGHAIAQNSGPAAAVGPQRAGLRGGMRTRAGIARRLFLSRLNLTNGQRGQIRKIVQSHRTDLRALADRALEARQALRAAITASSVSEDEIRTRSEALAHVQADMAAARANVRGEIMEVLTPEQREEARAVEETRAARVQRRMR